MPRNSSAQRQAAGGAQQAARKVRIVLGVLLGLNLIAAGMVLYPPGGSAEGLEQQLGSLQAQLKPARMKLEQTRQHTAAVEVGRGEGDEFLKTYFLGRRIVFSELVDELTAAADRAGLKTRGNAYSPDLIEGSDVLGMMTITANFEGSESNLRRFIREIDRSPSLLIIESLTAAPQTGSNTLTIGFKLDAFTQESQQPFPDGPVAGIQEQPSEEPAQ
jgi:hypothetical protein